MNILEQHWKKLSTDEIAEFENERRKLIKQIEEIEPKSWEDYLLLKWGTIKSYNYEKNEKAQEIIKKYNSEWLSWNWVMMQKDNERQVQFLFDLIDITDWTISSDWSWECFTKEGAKKYILDSK